jgi:hypothetical protein
MRIRIMSRLVVLAAAGATATTVGFATAGAASAATAGPARAHGTTLPTVATTSAAGYEASQRYFRYIASTLTVPDTSFLTSVYPQEYIQLSNGSLNGSGFSVTGDQYVRAGIESCVVAQSFGVPSGSCPTGDWTSFVEAFNNSLSGPYFSHYSLLSGVSQGDGVNFSIYYDQGGNELHFTITPPPTSGPAEFYKTRAYGPIFDHAAAVDDFTDSTGTPIALPPFIRSFRINQFLQGALTTYSGARGSFVGPWETSRVIATSNGLLPPSGTTRVHPSPLWSDGLSSNGTARPWDAFGIWTR